MNTFKQKLYFKTSSNFAPSSLKLKNTKVPQNFSKIRLINQDFQLPSIKLLNRESPSKDKLINNKVKLKKTKFLKSQEKLGKLIKEEENFKNYFLNIIQEKVRDEENDFNNFLLKSNDIADNDSIKNSFYNTFRNDDRNQRRIEREEKKVFPDKRKLGKNEIDSNDYLERFHSLFPNEFIEDESEIKKKERKVIIIQRYFREHRDKKKLFCGFEEPNYFIRIYEHEYDIYPMIKSVEIRLYSILFQKNVILYKTIEELFGVSGMSREKIKKRIGEIIGKIIGTKNKKNENRDYYDPAKADLSSDDFNDFEDDDS